MHVPRTRIVMPPLLALQGGANDNSKPQQPGVPLVTRARDAANNVMASKWLTALFVFFFTMAALLTVNPPMARDPHVPDRRSWTKMTTWSLLAFCTALVLPWCFPTQRIDI